MSYKVSIVLTTQSQRPELNILMTEKDLTDSFSQMKDGNIMISFHDNTGLINDSEEKIIFVPLSAIHYVRAK